MPKLVHRKKSRTFMCEICAKCYRMESTLKHHIEFKHTPRAELKYEMLQCHFCDDYFIDKKKLKLHLKTCSGAARLNKTSGVNNCFICHHCSLKFTKKARLVNHIKKIHTDRGKESIKCQYCESFFQNQHWLARHIKKCHLMGQNSGRNSNEINRVISHLQALNSVPQLDILAQAIGTSNLDFEPIENYRTLTVVQENNKCLFKCTKCGYKSPKLSFLKRHLLSHCSYKLIECPKCPSRFKFETSLKSHIKNRHEQVNLKKTDNYKLQVHLVPLNNEPNPETNCLTTSLISMDTNMSVDDSILNKIMKDIPDNSLPFVGADVDQLLSRTQTPVPTVIYKVLTNDNKNEYHTESDKNNFAKTKDVLINTFNLNLGVHNTPTTSVSNQFVLSNNLFESENACTVEQNCNIEKDTNKNNLINNIGIMNNYETTVESNDINPLQWEIITVSNSNEEEYNTENHILPNNNNGTILCDTEIDSIDNIFKANTNEPNVDNYFVTKNQGAINNDSDIIFDNTSPSTLLHNNQPICVSIVDNCNITKNNVDIANSVSDSINTAVTNGFSYELETNITEIEKTDNVLENSFDLDFDSDLLRELPNQESCYLDCKSIYDASQSKGEFVKDPLNMKEKVVVNNVISPVVVVDSINDINYSNTLTEINCNEILLELNDASSKTVYNSGDLNSDLYSIAPLDQISGDSILNFNRAEIFDMPSCINTPALTEQIDNLDVNSGDFTDNRIIDTDSFNYLGKENEPSVLYEIKNSSDMNILDNVIKDTNSVELLSTNLITMENETLSNNLTFKSDLDGIAISEVSEKKSDSTPKTEDDLILNLLSEKTIKAFAKADYPYDCKICFTRFFTEKNLKEHVIIVHNKNEFTCDYCGSQLKSKKSLIFHIKKHLGPKRVQCQVCAVSLAPSSLRAHMRKHNNVTPYRCLLCDRRFASTLKRKHHVLKYHLKKGPVSPTATLMDMINKIDTNQESHCDIAKPQVVIDCVNNSISKKPSKLDSSKIKECKRFVCTFCSKEYNNRSNLHRHKKLHTREKIQCQKCGVTVDTNRDLLIHNRHFHLAKTYTLPNNS